MRPYLLDTNVISYIARQDAGLREKLRRTSEDSDIAISVLTETELLYGLRKRPVRAAVQREVEHYLSIFPVMPWTRRCADRYAEIRVLNESAGRSLGTVDLQIAAQASALDATLATGDVMLSRAAGVRAEHWPANAIH